MGFDISIELGRGLALWVEERGGLTYGRSGFEVEDSRAVIAAGRSTLGTGDVSVSMSIMARRGISTMLCKNQRLVESRGSAGASTFCDTDSTVAEASRFI